MCVSRPTRGCATSRGGWLLGAQALLHGNPYDGHTLASAMKQIERIAPQAPEDVFVDQGAIAATTTRGRRGKIPRAPWRWMKRCAAVEPAIGHLKAEHRMNRNRPRGAQGDALNAILAAASMNPRKLAVFLRLLAHRLASHANRHARTIGHPGSQTFINACRERLFQERL